MRLTVEQLKTMSEAWIAEYNARLGEAVPVRVVKIDGPRLTPEEVWTTGVENFLSSERSMYASPSEAVKAYVARIKTSKR